MFDNKILEENTRILDRIVIANQKKHLLKDKTPMTMTFLVTGRCNLKCKHCFNSKTVDSPAYKEELTLEEYEKLSRNMGFISSAFFGGGEPFIRNDFAEIVNIFRKYSNLQYGSVTSNGQLTDSILKQSKEICESNSKNFTFNFSLDGYEKEHDLTRKKGAYENCIRTIKEMNEIKKNYPNMKLGIVSTMTTLNQCILTDFFDYISQEVHPDVISLLLVRQSPRAGEMLKQIDISNYISAKEKLNELFLKGKNGNINTPTGYLPLAFYDIIEKTMKTGNREFLCYAGRHGGYVDYDGTVNVCEVMGDMDCSKHSKILGNLRDYDMDFLELWNSEKAKKVKSEVNRNECCLKCTHETEGLLPSIYFEPNSYVYKARMEENANKLLP